MLTYDAEAAVAHLRGSDPVLARIMDGVGPFTLEPREGTFRMLSRAIFFQQLAGPAARAIMNRVLGTLGADEEGWYEPQQLLTATEEQLRTAGLSRQKTVYVRDLAEKFTSGELSEDGFHELDDEEVIRRVSAVKGIGRWTGEMFLIFSLGRPDVLPVDDLGVRRDIHCGAESAGRSFAAARDRASDGANGDRRRRPGQQRRSGSNQRSPGVQSHIDQ